MNPLIRLCGQKRSHRLRDLTGDAEGATPVLALAPPMWWLIDETSHWTVTGIAAESPLSANLRNAREKSAMGNLLNV